MADSTPPGGTLKVTGGDLQSKLNQLQDRAHKMEAEYAKSEDIANGVRASMQTQAGRIFVQKIEIWQRAVRSCMAEYNDIIEAIEATMNIMVQSSDDATVTSDMWDGDVYSGLLGR
ncbi:hypothetical protein [Streptomyces sp. NPDC090025]|uniref:hypothetical protein n=1 Tax=Streptomyces sp. NPDC090025 TaxID=3365922 RepID=UPI0038359D86